MISSDGPAVGTEISGWKVSDAKMDVKFQNPAGLPAREGGGRGFLCCSSSVLSARGILLARTQFLCVFCCKRIPQRPSTQHVLRSGWIANCLDPVPDHNPLFTYLYCYCFASSS